jgi:hypothetical protein
MGHRALGVLGQESRETQLYSYEKLKQSVYASVQESRDSSYFLIVPLLPAPLLP